jgi:competence protein ComEA
MRVGVGALVRIGRKHAWAVALLVLVAVVASSAWSMRARAVEVTPIASAVPKSPTAESVPARSATPSPAPTVTVHVMGAVANPGVLTLPAPARVRDAITAAGGLRADADPGELNLAALVADGAQIVIGTTAKPRGEVRTGAGASGQAEGTGAAPGGATLIDLNTATADDLDGLPGVGPVTAQAILAWRAKHGRFTSIDELQEVDGIGPKTFAQIAPHVRV